MPLLSLDEEDNMEPDEGYPDSIPILALKNTVLFPGIVIPITVGRDKSIKAINSAYGEDRIIGVLSQKDHLIENPSPEDLYQVGTVARILKLLKMPDGTATAIIQGRRRFSVREFTSESPFLVGNIDILAEQNSENAQDREY